MGCNGSGMTKNFTAGPWSLNGSKVRSFTTEVRLSVDRVWGPHATVVGENNVANAKLIAAAPDLLAALEQFTNCSQVRDIVAGDTELACAVFAARAAISKAVNP